MTFEQEIGTGSPTATSYTSVAFGDSHVASFMTGAYADAWNAAAETDKEMALNLGSKAQGTLYRVRMKGRRRTEEQSLLFPRVGVSDGEFLVRSDEVPIDWQRGTVELAARHLGGETLVSDVASGANVKAKAVGVSGGPFSRKEFSGSESSQTSFPEVDGYCDPFITGTGSRVLG